MATASPPWPRGREAILPFPHIGAGGGYHHIPFLEKRYLKVRVSTPRKSSFAFLKHCSSLSSWAWSLWLSWYRPQFHHEVWLWHSHRPVHQQDAFWSHHLVPRQQDAEDHSWVPKRTKVKITFSWIWNLCHCVLFLFLSLKCMKAFGLPGSERIQQHLPGFWLELNSINVHFFKAKTKTKQ